MPSELLTERHDATLVLTLSGPETRNTLSAQACAAGVEALNVAESDDAVRCVVLRGDGTHFSAGLDPSQGPECLQGFVEALRGFPKPVIAAVEGDALGAGLTLALACDLKIAAEDARFEWPGLSPDDGARQLEAWGLVNRVVDKGHAVPEALRWASELAHAPAGLLARTKALL